MAEKVFLIHGWSVDTTATYQALHLKLAQNGFELEDVFLGRYVSLDNDVEISDISQAMQAALREKLGPPPWDGPFHMITHSTGALVVKHWVVEHYAGTFAEKQGLRNIVFLAGPHFGSRLAHHGRSMLSHAVYFGDTGRQVLKSLELGSRFSWDTNESWLDDAHWWDKGVRPYCLIGDRVEGNVFKKRIFPAGFESGSDMVVRVPAANLNHRRYRLDGTKGKVAEVGRISGVPFAALDDYVHSGEKNGIMNSIKKEARPSSHQSLRLILQCLKVKSAAAYKKAFNDLEAVTRKTRKRRSAFAQIDFRFRDDSGRPIDDYSVVLGAVVNGKRKASKTIAHTHKNKVDESQFTVFLNLDQFEPDLTYFFTFDVKTDAELYDYEPDPFHVDVAGKRLSEIISAEQTTQIDVILSRRAHRNLFVFHAGDDGQLHVEWDRRGRIKDTDIEPE